MTIKNFKNHLNMIILKNPEMICLPISIILLFGLFSYFLFPKMDVDVISAIITGVYLILNILFRDFDLQKTFINIINKNITEKRYLIIEFVKNTIIHVFLIFVLLIYDKDINGLNILASLLICQVLSMIHFIFIRFRIYKNDLIIYSLQKLFICLLLSLIYNEYIFIISIVALSILSFNLKKHFLKLNYSPYNISVAMYMFTFVLILIVRNFYEINAHYTAILYIILLTTLLNKSVANMEIRINSSNLLNKIIIYNTIAFNIFIIILNFSQINLTNLIQVNLLFYLSLYIYSEFRIDYKINNIISIIMILLMNYLFTLNISHSIGIYLLLLIIIVPIVYYLKSLEYYILIVKLVVLNSILLILFPSNIFIVSLLTMLVHEFIHIYYYKLFIGETKIYSKVLSTGLNYKYLDKLTDKQLFKFYLYPTISTSLLVIVLIVISNQYWVILLITLSNFIPFKNSDMYNYRLIRKEKCISLN